MEAFKSIDPVSSSVSDGMRYLNHTHSEPNPKEAIEKQESDETYLFTPKPSNPLPLPISPSKLSFSLLKPILQPQALPTPLFSSPTPPVQPVCRSTRTPLPPLAIQGISRSSPPPSQSNLSPKIPLGTPAPPPALSYSPHTPTGTPPLRYLKEEDNFEDEIIDISADDTDNVEELIDRELLAELDAIAQKAYEEDTYSDVDYENLPDHYWEMEYENEE